MNNINYNIFVVHNHVVWFCGFVMNKPTYILITQQIDLKLIDQVQSRSIPGMRSRYTQTQYRHAPKFTILGIVMGVIVRVGKQ